METTNTNIFNVNDFEVDVMQADGLVLVDFWAEWCGPCKMIAPVLEEIAQEKEGSVTVVKVNVEEHPDLAQRFGITALPTLHYFKGGAVQDTVFGMAPKQAIIKKIDSLI